MIDFRKVPRSSLAGMLGRSAFSDDEIADLRRKAWHEQSLLIVSASDPRLTGPERHHLRKLARRLYEGEPSCR